MLKLLKGFTAVSLSALMAFSAVATAAAAADDAYAGAQVINVSAADLRDGAQWALQSALDQAKNQATASNPVTVKAAAGSYDLGWGLKIYDNTTLDLSGVTLRRTFSGNMLRVGYEDQVNSGAVGYQYKNIKLVGGTYDGNNGENTMLKVAHAKNFSMENVTVINEREGHMMEVAGCDGFTATGCTFRDQVLTPHHDGYEAIQFDILHPKHVVNCRAEDLNCKNILVENCVFDNVPRAVGTHTGILNNPFDGITIRNNTFRNLKSIAVQGMNWINVDIRMNVIENAPRGITVYSVMDDGSGIFKSSELSSLGGTTSHVSSSYQTPKKANINICYNTLKNVGSLADGFADYESQGIAVLGNKLERVFPKDSVDGSGALPVGDYYNDDVSIYGNYVDIRGNGIRLEDVRNASVTRNEILCSKNTVKSANYYGIVLRDNAQVDGIEYNTIKNAEVNGIQIDSSKVGTINYNDIISPGKYGMGVYTTTIGSITDNYVTSAKSEGITLLWSSRADKIKWNRVRSCSGTGIYVSSNSSSGDVSSNLTYNCGGGINTPNKGSNYTSPSPLTKFYLEKDGVKMGVGTAYKLVPDVRPVNAIESFSYSSANSSIAAVDAYGRITAKKQGSTTVTVTSSNGIRQSYRVEVNGGSGVSYLEPKVLDTPQISGFRSTAQGVEISIAKVDGAYGYRVFYKGSSGWKAMGNTTNTTFIDTDVRNGGTYTYTVRCIDANGNFTSSYNNTGWTYTYNYQLPQLATPQITKFESTDQGVKITWNAVSGAYGYRVFYKGSSGWKGMDNVTTNTYIDEDVRIGGTYTYTVRCMDKDGSFVSSYNNTGWTYTYQPKQLDTPQITKFESPDQGVKITWNAINGAYGYRVFYKGSSGWKGMDNVTTNTYVDEDVRVGGTYTYTVRCVDQNGKFTSGYNDNGWTYTYQPKQLDTPQITGFQSTAQGVKITWNKVSGAYGYRVFYKGSSGWKGMDNVTTNTYLDTDVRNGGTYIYTVRCIDKNGKFTSGYNDSGWTYKYSYTTTSYPEFTLANESNGVRIRWNSMSGVYGYRVFYKNSKGNWVSMDTVTGTSYLDTDVRNGSTYTYTVRGVDKNGSYVTSFLSSGKTIIHN